MDRDRTLGSPFLDAELFAPEPRRFEAPENETPLRVHAFTVVDAAEKRLANVAYSVHQGGKTDHGTLSSAGAGTFVDVDPRQSFRLHVEGRVCAIVDGALLVQDDRAVQYGGQFVDWRLADVVSADLQFWRHYTVERKADAAGPMRFWQHDHIMRRPIRLRSANAIQGKAPVFQAVPLRVRVGPLVRFTNESCALIWVELETPGLVRVRYRRSDDQMGVPKPGKTLRELDMQSRHAATVRVGGRHFAIVRVDELTADTVYQYTVELAPLPAVDPIPKTESQFAAVFPSSLEPAVRDSLRRQLSPASFRNDHWLFFRTLRLDYETLRFAHGSCRKYPGDTDTDGKVPGPDMLAEIATGWLAKQKTIGEWPRFFLHTGDQIYADQIGAKQGDRIMSQRFGSVIPGPHSGGGVQDGAWAGRFADRYVAINVHRAVIAAPAQRRGDGFIDAKRPMRFQQRVTNALLWNIPYEKSKSPRVTPTGLKHRDGKSEYPSAGDDGGVHAADFAEFSYLHERAWSVEGARKTLAHLPSFMIFDDHEITDDWNSNANWVDIVHGNHDDPYDMWPTTITDGLAAYWMYQGWGNLPPGAWGSDPRVKILERARDSGQDALAELRTLILECASKPARPGVKAPQQTRQQKPQQTSQQTPQRLTWYYPLPIRSPQFFVVDDRTEREVFGVGGPFQQQLHWLETGLNAARASAAFVVFPTPFLLPHPLSWAMTHPGLTSDIEAIYKLLVDHKLDVKTIERIKRDADMEHAAGNEVWNHLLRMLTRIQDSVTPLKTIAFVSGDVHFSCNLDGRLMKFDPPPQPHLLQLVSSGMRAALSSAKQKQLHRGYSWFGFSLTGSHRGMSVRLGGFNGRGGDNPNFVFPTSVALVDVDVRKKDMDSRIQGDEIPNVAIRQQHLFKNPKTGAIDAYDFSYENNEASGPRLLTPARTS